MLAQPNPGVTLQMSQWFNARSCCQPSNNGSGLTGGTRELSSPSGQHFPRGESCQNPEPLPANPSQFHPDSKPLQEQIMGTQLIPAAQTQITFPSLVNVEGPSPVLAEFPFLLWQQLFFFLQDGLCFIWDEMLLKPCRNWQAGLRSCRQALFLWAAGVGEH